jgi:peptidoglycan/xylan/chitin deacetylase (PgdA/CDA1 family)
VKEFFQLFKTPWEFYRQGKSYDVVVASANEIPRAQAKLFVVYGADHKTCDSRIGVTAISKIVRDDLDYRGIQVPIYGSILTFNAKAGIEPCVSASTGMSGLKVRFEGATLVRVGYDVFEEAEFLLKTGQPVDRSIIPTLEIHIRMLRDWILDAGLPLAEILPLPADHGFTVCLTHDIDFIGIRNHLFDHTMWGFLYRSTWGAFWDFLKGRTSISRLLRNWRAAASLPFVYLGWAKDFWLLIEWYLRVEQGLPATYFVIPFKNRPGERLSLVHSKRRASAYDIMDIPEWTARLISAGCEIGVHGIDAWHDVERGREERERIAAATGKDEIGLRTHWLLSDEKSAEVIENAGFVYDSTAGYNETVGYRSGTTQVFRPPGAENLLELPIHIQDGALFFPQRLGLAEEQAWERCQIVVRNVQAFGGVLNIIWHDRSPGPERFWGDFYERLLRELKDKGAWFATALQVVRWFQSRRSACFEPLLFPDGRPGVKLACVDDKINPPLLLRLYRPSFGGLEGRSDGRDGRTVTDLSWSGEADIILDPTLMPCHKPKIDALL